MTKKKKAWGKCSKYIRLRDSIEYCKKHGMHPEDGFVKCCTCSTIKQWKYMDAGHFISKGTGGHSGVYFDERNIHAQCKPCNGFNQGNALAYRAFMLDKYGEGVIEELEIRHRIGSYKGQYDAIGEMYKELYKELKEK